MQIIDFIKYKENKENDLENKYLKKLSSLNKLFGLPTDFQSAVEVLYYGIRYIEGTVNGMMILTLFSNVDDITLQKLKNSVINWLEEIIDNIKKL